MYNILLTFSFFFLIKFYKIYITYFLLVIITAWSLLNFLLLKLFLVGLKNNVAIIIFGKDIEWKFTEWL